MSYVFYIFLWATSLIVPIIFYFVLKPMISPHKNKVFGVLIPHNELGNSDLSSIKVRFTKELKTTTLLVIAFSLPLLIQNRYFGIYINYYMLYVFIGCFIMYLPYARAFKRTKLFKKEKGWVTEGARVIKIDTKLSSEKSGLKITWVDFIIPLIITLLSFLPYTRLDTDHDLYPLWLKILISVSIMGSGLLVYPLISKFPNKVYGDDSELNIKINFKKKNLLSLIILSATIVGAITDLCTSFVIFGWIDFTVYIILTTFFMCNVINPMLIRCYEVSSGKPFVG